MLDSVNPEAGAGSADLRKGRRKKSANDARAVSSVDRLPPHSVEAEQGVLGCIFLSPHECVGECIEKFKMGPTVFYDLRHQVIYELVVEMYDRKEAIDVITVQQRRRIGTPEELVSRQQRGQRSRNQTQCEFCRRFHGSCALPRRTILLVNSCHE